jgi:hypothetical protein
MIERKGLAAAAIEQPKPEEALPRLRDTLETHRLEMEDGVVGDDLAAWMKVEHPDFDVQRLGFQEFAEFLNFAQDKTVVRIEPDEEKGLMVFLGAEFYPPAPQIKEEEPVAHEYDEKQPIVAGQPSMVEPTPPLPEPKPAKRAPRKRKPADGNTAEKPKRRTSSRPRKIME